MVWWCTKKGIGEEDGMPKVTDQIKIKAEWDGQPVDRGLKNITDDLKRIERNAKEAATATGKMGGSFGKLQSEVSGVLSKLGPIGPAIAGAFGAAAIAQVGRTAHEMALLANQFDLTSDAFDRLARRAGSTAPAELEKLRNAVGGTLSDLRLMQSVGAAVDAGLTFEQSRTAVEFLRRYSLAFGKDFNQLTSTIFTGLQRGSTLMLDDAGIIIDASSDIYKGLSDVEKKSALVGTAIQLMGEKMKTLPRIEDDVITSTGRLASSWENLKTGIGYLVSGPVLEGLNVAQGAIQGIADVLNSLAATEPPNIVPTITEDQLNKMREARNILNLHGQPKKDGETFDVLLERVLNQLEKTKIKTTGLERTPGLTPQQSQIVSNLAHQDLVKITDDLPIESFLDMDQINREINEGYDAIQRLYDKTQSIEDKIRKSAEEAWQRLQNRVADFKESFSHGPGLAETITVIAKYKALEEEDVINALGGTENYNRIMKEFDDTSKETSDTLGTLTQDLAELGQGLSDLSPQISSFIKGISAIIQSIATMRAAQTALGAVGGAVGIFAAGVGLLSSLFGRGKSAAEEYAERQRAAEEATRRTAEALRQFENAVQEKSLRELKSLKGSYEVLLKINTSNPIGRDIKAYQSTYAQLDAVNAQIARFGGALNTVGEAFQRYQHLVNIRNITDPTQKMTLFVEELNALGQRVQNGGLFAYIDKEGEERALGDFYRSLKAGNATLEDLYAHTEQYNFQDRRRIIEHLAQLERNIRQEQADVMIAQIEKQRRDVLEALSNAEEAQRRAALRAVELQFDFAEAELRARYQPLFAGAGGDRAQLSVLRDSALRDIETLRARESGATESILNQISKNFSAERDRQTTLYDQTAKAIRDAVPDLSKPFADAIEAQTSALISAWEADPTGASLTVALPPAVESTLSKVLEWADSQLDIPDPPKLPALPEDFWGAYPPLPKDFWGTYPALPEDFWTPYPALPPWQPYLDMPPWPEYSPFNWPPNYPTFAWPAYPPLPPWSPYSPLPPWPDYSPFAWPEYPHPDPLPLAIPDGGLPLAIPDGGLPVAVDSIETPPPVIMSPGIDTEQLKSELLNEILQRLQENSPLRRYVINADGDIVDIGTGTG